MADIRINQLPPGGGPVATDFLPLDNGSTRKATVQAVVEIGRPAAAQAEAEAGTNPTKVMTPLTVKQSIASEVGVSIASAAQGALAATAVQPARAVNAGTGLTGGGDLSADRTIALNAASIASLARADSSEQATVDRNALKALDTTITTVAFLKEGGRDGSFKWTLGNFSTQVAADTTEAIYIKANAVAATVGAWVRQAGWQVSGIDIAWAGTPQAAATLAGALGVKTIYGAGTYTLTSTLTLPTLVRLFGSNKALTITQGNGANLSELINLGAGCSVVECIIDGNSANNTNNSSHVAIRIGNSNDCVVDNNTVQNLTGNGIVVNNGFRAKIRGNSISVFYDHGIAAFGTDGNYYHTIEGNRITSVGWAGIFVSHSNYVDVHDNKISGTLIGGRGARTVVNTSGTTVTWVSGPNFATARAGNFVVVNSGAEFRITSASATSLTVATTLPTLSGVQATVGSGDLIGIQASNFCSITENTVDNTATFLFGFSLGNTAIQCGNNSVFNNILNFAGKNAINLNGAVGSGFLSNNSIGGNKIFNAGYGGGIGTTDLIAIFLASGTPGQVNDTYISDNTVVSFAGSGQTTYWLGTDGQLSFGSVFVNNNNKALDVANKGIFGDIVSITLSSDWGSTAATSAITSHGSQLVFTITCSGTGYASNPNFTINKICDTPNDPPLPTAKIVSNSGGALLSTMWGEQLSVRGSWRAFMAATPASGHVYVFFVKA